MDAFPKDFIIETTNNLYYNALSQTDLMKTARESIYKMVMDAAKAGAPECDIHFPDGMNVINIKKLMEELRQRGFEACDERQDGLEYKIKII
jgi:hypothetical protein